MLAFIDAFVLFTRTDIGFMLFVPTAYVFLFKRKCTALKMFMAGIIGLSPYLIWEIFSVFYFGAWFPNPFYVKVGTSISIMDYMSHGVQYLIVSFIYDVVLIVPIFIAIIALSFNREIRFKMFGIGILMKVLWVLYMGGDFMLGRHFTDSFFASIAWIVVIMNSTIKNADKADEKEKVLRFISYSVIIICAFVSVENRIYIADANIFPQRRFEAADEKAGYYPTLGLLPRLLGYVSEGGIDTLDYGWGGEVVDSVKEAIARGDKGFLSNFALGVIAYKYNEKIYLIDNLALGDGFLSKFPSVIDGGLWRVGHTFREVPEGYVESIKYGDNRLEDPNLKEYYDMYLEVTRGKLFSGKRIKLAFEFAIGKYQYLIDRYVDKNKQ